VALAPRFATCCSALHRNFIRHRKLRRASRAEVFFRAAELAA
jgi:hypothetical protein